MADIFHEVDEEVRREKLKKLWDRYGNLLVAVCIAIIVAVGAWRGYEWWQAKKAGETGAAFENAVSLAETGKHQEAEAAFAKIATDGTAGYRTLAKLREAAALAQTDKSAAIKAYDDLAPTGARATWFGNWPRCVPVSCSSIRLLIRRCATRLEPLTGSDKIFRHTARELLALSAWKSGDVDAAKQWTGMIITDPQSPQSTRNRAEVLSELIAAGDKG